MLIAVFHGKTLIVHSVQLYKAIINWPLWFVSLGFVVKPKELRISVLAFPSPWEGFEVRAGLQRTKSLIGQGDRGRTESQMYTTEASNSSTNPRRLSSRWWGSKRMKISDEGLRRDEAKHEHSFPACPLTPWVLSHQALLQPPPLVGSYMHLFPVNMTHLKITLPSFTRHGTLHVPTRLQLTLSRLLLIMDSCWFISKCM